MTTMIPTAEEKQKISEAQVENPEIPLGNAEQLLLTMSTIAELEARLQLWAFKLDYDTCEKVCCCSYYNCGSLATNCRLVLD